MATKKTSQILSSKKLQTRRLGGAIPRWEVFSPQQGYSLGQFGMSEDKEKRIRAKAQTAGDRRRGELANKNLTPVTAYHKPSFMFGDKGGEAAVASRHFVVGNHGRASADRERIDPYLGKIGARLNELKRNGQINLLTHENLAKITGIDINKAGGWKMLGAVLAAAENPELQDEAAYTGLNKAFEKWQDGGPLDEKLNNESVKNLINASSLSPEMKAYLQNPTAQNWDNVYIAIPKYEQNLLNQAVDADIQRRADKWVNKHGESDEEAYVEGLLGNSADRQDSPVFKAAQDERRNQNLDVYLAGGEGTPSQKKKAKHSNPDLYEAGFPDGEQEEIPLRKLVEEPELDLSSLVKPIKPDLTRIINPAERKKALDKYAEDMDIYEHERTTLEKESDWAADRNDKTIARNMALRKRRNQQIAETNYKDNLIMERKLLRDKKKEYEKAKYEKSKEKNVLGAHDFWNVMRGPTGSTPDSVGSIGGITNSLAAANQAIKEGPKDWRKM